VYGRYSRDRAQSSLPSAVQKGKYANVPPSDPINGHMCNIDSPHCGRCAVPDNRRNATNVVEDGMTKDLADGLNISMAMWGEW